MTERQTLQQQLKDVSQVATHPEFIRVLEKIREAPPNKKRAILRRWARPTVFKRLGIPLAPGIRVTTRYFFEDQKIEGKFASRVSGPRRKTARQPQAAGVCVCVGGGACVGVGG